MVHVYAWLPLPQSMPSGAGFRTRRQHCPPCAMGGALGHGRGGVPPPRAPLWPLYRPLGAARAPSCCPTPCHTAPARPAAVKELGAIRLTRFACETKCEP